jgi:isoquinoline 1-oxidoreductase beta subunit
MPGVVKVLKETDFVGVVAHSLLEAENAKAAIEVQWETQGDLQTSDIRAMVEVGKGTAFVIQKEGDAEGILKESSTNLVSELLLSDKS